MSKEYVFEFHGTKEAFLDILNDFPKNSYCKENYYYFDDYIVKLINGEIHFGVERGGHSGGYWFIPKITESCEKIKFCGTIGYVDSNDNCGAIRKIINKIEEFLLLILLLPFILVFKLYALIEWSIRKIFNCPKPKDKAMEDRLLDLMENHLGCVRK